VVQHAAETAARLLHTMRRQAAEQDTAAALQQKADALQEMCSSLVTTVKEVTMQVERPCHSSPRGHLPSHPQLDKKHHMQPESGGASHAT
jgi:hypothetical protein